MRKKKPYQILTFHTTSAAMAMELYCKEHDISGRLIPVPRELSAGCGLAWGLTPTVVKYAGRTGVQVIAFSGLQAAAAAVSLIWRKAAAVTRARLMTRWLRLTKSLRNRLSN